MDSTKISIEEAIRAGKKKVHTPVYVFLLVGILITFIFTTNLFFGKPLLPTEFILIGAWITLISSIFFGNKLISKWKLWAFESVDDVIKLKARAIEERLLYKNSRFMEKAEFKSEEETLRWNKILLKFDESTSSHR